MENVSLFKKDEIDLDIYWNHFLIFFFKDGKINAFSATFDSTLLTVAVSS